MAAVISTITSPYPAEVAANKVNSDFRRLTRKESELLDVLRRNQGRCLSRDYLLSVVWGYQPGVRSRTVDVHIQRLRRKLGAIEGSRILTLFRSGYVWTPEGGFGLVK